MLEVRWLDTQALADVNRLLRRANIIAAPEQVQELAPAGEGNMNVTLRVTVATPAGEQRSLIVKQSRPFVAKYDSIPAPLERVEFEAAFYQFVSQFPELASRMPRRLGWIPEEHALVLEDLGPATDASSWYDTNHAVSPQVVRQVLVWLQTLHVQSRGRVDACRFGNRRLRELNHEHIFVLPFQDPPAVDLDTFCAGLASATRTLRKDAALRKRCSDLGQVYLQNGPCLLHGDFYPGSWLLADSSPRIIDPEFCYAGSAEFDLGILLAHLQLTGFELTDSLYTEIHAGYDWPLSMDLIHGFAAVEILRRLLGVAQLPLSIDLAERTQLIAWAESILR